MTVNGNEERIEEANRMKVVEEEEEKRKKKKKKKGKKEQELLTESSERAYPEDEELGLSIP